MWIRRAGQIGYAAVLIVVAFLALFPIVWLLAGSLQTIQELYGSVTFLPRVPQFANYAKAWNEGHFSTYIPNSFLYSLSTVAGVLLAASMAGYALARIQFPGRNAVMLVILALLIIPLPASFIALYKLLVFVGLTNTRVGYVPR